MANNTFNDESYKISIVPNPSLYAIKIQANKEEKFRYQIIDFMGKVVKSDASKFNEQINIEQLTKGIYLIQIETEKGAKMTEKLIKN